MDNHAPEAGPAQLTEAKVPSLARELFTSNFWMSGLAVLKYIPRSFRVKQVDQVKAEIELCESPAVLDLEEVDLVDVQGVRSLNACEAKGISVVHCSPYIRNWMTRERSLPEARAQKRKGRTGVSGK